MLLSILEAIYDTKNDELYHGESFCCHPVPSCQASFCYHRYFSNQDQSTEEIHAHKSTRELRPKLHLTSVDELLAFMYDY